MCLDGYGVNQELAASKLYAECQLTREKAECGDSATHSDSNFCLFSWCGLSALQS